MRLKILCHLSSEEFPLDYRRKIMMIIKKGMKKEYPTFFSNLYEQNTQKNFTFSVYLNQPSFEEKAIKIRDKKCTINFSTGEAELAIVFYNIFTSLKNEKIKLNENVELKINSVEVMPTHKIETNQIKCRTLSPIVIRDHNQTTQKDWFYILEDEGAMIILKRNMKTKLNKVHYGESIEQEIEDMKIQQVKFKKTVVKFYKMQIAASVGEFEIKASPRLLNIIIQNGLGSMTGSGFGMLEQL
ncbi:CRISPR-associated endoribonuclease Cas6 [Listeria seeligeri]|uniref:CRISPR-associated endoribonuclease Cas6 n=1 Tax=Listeria seeligeri TaxID=1640 RepID=UPI0009527B3D|nr:CRISPR-associated endoribonuclease Cas6 [Listeria seeligeri]MBC1933017.1 CRISPR-associated endoribonuclease Cas6 [Listeria seeligeri]MBF2373755.1 CRISPR-associated endoribonuclease Cas6 [Listeria seeligeri]OLQ24449.1 CRISPR-associated endoribonuclease Cas6 [Listeria seeligeri]